MDGKVLLIGSNGFLGQHVKALLINENIDFIDIEGKKHLDITNYDKFDKFLISKNIETIINCSAFVGGISFGYKYQADLLEKNSQMSLNIYNLAKDHNIKRIINPISNCVYPGDLEVYEEKNFWNGSPHESVFNYGLAKRMTVALGKSFYEQYSISSTNVILSNMYGPNDHFDEERSHALGAIIKKVHDAKKNNLEKVQIWGSGKPIREWLYVEDGAKSLIKSLNLNEGFYLFNIGINKGSSIIEIANQISDSVQYEGSFEYDLSKPDGVMKKTVDGEYGKEILNWSPEVNLKEGISKTVKWYINNHE